MFDDDGFRSEIESPMAGSDDGDGGCGGGDSFACFRRVAFDFFIRSDGILDDDCNYSVISGGCVRWWWLLLIG